MPVAQNTQGRGSSDVPTTTICPACRAGMREADTFCWTCGSPRGGAVGAAAPDRLEVVHRPDPTRRAARSHGRGPSRRQAGRVIAVFSVALVAAVGIAAWWLLKPDEDTTTTVQAAPTRSTPAATPSADPEPVSAPPATAEATPTVQYPTGVLVPSKVTAPSTSPDSADSAGRTTTYRAANVLDGDPSTAWRTEGNASGSTLQFSFDSPVRITEVGLVNGFAKVDPHDGTDRYTQGRRVLAVTWTFTTPTGPVTVQQQLRDGDRALQRVPVPAVEASSVALTVDSVTRPGAGGRFDRTAISDVQFVNA